MKSRYLLILFPLLAAGLLLAAGWQSAQAQSGEAPPAASAAALGEGTTSDEGGPELRATERISIPYGIVDELPLHGRGQAVTVSGHGSCFAGHQVTVVVTVTHTTGATAQGEVTMACNSEMQQWHLVAATPGQPLAAGPAEACGLATTYGPEPETYYWCKDVALSWWNFLPSLFK